MNRRKIGKPVEPRSIQNQNYNQTYLHHKTCHELFQKAESDETLWVRFEEIIYTDEMGKSNFYEEEMKTIEVSIITQSIMDYDRRMFSNMMEFTNNILDDSYYYRPYFLSFLISVDEVKENNYSMSFLRNEENLHQWFRAGFSDLNSDKDVLEFPGWFQTAASPIIYKRKTLFVEDKYLSPKVVAEINTLYDLGNNYCSTDKKIENMLATQFPSGYFHEARIYSVGNGNCVYLHGKNGNKKTRLLFDIGFHVGATPPRQLKVNKTKKAISAIRNFRPDCIVLSHWDSDHYMGCAYASYRIFNCTWVAPDCYDASPNARRLAKYLQIKKKLLVVTRGKSRLIADLQGNNAYFKLWMGSKVPNVKEDKGITKANKEGLIIEVKNDIIHTLMMGDVPYRSLPVQLNFTQKNPFDYLIVPHHGAYMNFNLLRQNLYVNSNLALICAKRGQNRPHQEHNAALMQSGYTVKLTDEANFRIDLDLTRQYNFVIRD